MADRERVLSLINAAWTTQVIAAACELSIADALGDRSASSSDVATKVSASPDAVRRLLRAMTALRLCEEPAPDLYALTADGASLRSDDPESLNAWARLSGGHLWRNWGTLAQSIATGESARSRLDGTAGFEFLNEEADFAALFNRAMVDLTRPVAQALARELDWRGIARVVDVGGGRGEVLATLLQTYPHMTGAVFDLAHAAGAARAWLSTHGVADRSEIIVGSFFDSMPAGADAYVLKSVLHNWSDASARRILESCRAAMDREARVIVVERIAPTRISDSPSDRDLVRSDLNMLVGCGGRERTARQFDELLGSAGLAVTSVSELVAGFSSIIAVPSQAPRA